MKRTEVSFEELQNGDTIVRRSRNGQTPGVVSLVFKLATGEMAFRVEGENEQGVYYKEAKFVMAYREGDPPKTQLELLIDKVKEDMNWHAAQMERIGNSEDPSYNFHLGWVDSMSSIRLRLEKML